MIEKIDILQQRESACGHHHHLRAEGLSAKSPKQFFNFGDCSFSLFRLHFSLYIVKFLYFFIRISLIYK